MNAVEFSPEGGRIEIVLQRRGPFLCLECRDHGPDHLGPVPAACRPDAQAPGAILELFLEVRQRVGAIRRMHYGPEQPARCSWYAAHAVHSGEARIAEGRAAEVASVV